jgi:hypothetical protein
MAEFFRVQQSSPFAPAVCFHGGQLHMVFVAANDTRELLHAVSNDGFTWFRKENLGQSTKQAPAIASLRNQLRVIFVANNDTNQLLKCTYDDVHDSWSQNIQLGRLASNSAATLEQFGSTLFMYWVSDDGSSDIQGTTI